MPLETIVCFGVCVCCPGTHWSVWPSTSIINQAGSRGESDVSSTAACVTSFHCPIDTVCHLEQSGKVNSTLITSSLGDTEAPMSIRTDQLNLAVGRGDLLPWHADLDKHP